MKQKPTPEQMERARKAAAEVHPYSHNSALILDGERDGTDIVQSALTAIIQSDQQLMEARTLVAEANNSLYGSQNYFHSTNGGPFDKHHLARPIEALKERARKADQQQAELLSHAEAMAGALEKHATRFRHCADMIAESHGISGRLRAERTVKARHYALEAEQSRIAFSEFQGGNRA